MACPCQGASLLDAGGGDDWFDLRNNQILMNKLQKKKVWRQFFTVQYPTAGALRWWRCWRRCLRKRQGKGEGGREEGVSNTMLEKIIQLYYNVFIYDLSVGRDKQQ